MVKSLLIVDDDPAQRRILEETIKRLGFETKSASSGEQAVQILEGPARADIGLVLLDLVMGGLDGMAVLDRLNGKPGLPPIIVQTAHGSIDAAINAMRAGAVDFVVKPASPERLEVSIKSALKIEALAGELKRIKRGANPWYEVKISEGRQNQIRVMFKHFGKLVEKLRRVKIGFFELDVAPSRYRLLLPKEVDRFKKLLKMEG